MNATTTAHHSTASGSVGHVSPLRPLRWLASAWDDLTAMPGASLRYGVVVTLGGWLIFAFGDHPFFIAAAVSVFLLIGPILSTGLCELSRRRSQDTYADFESSLEALGRNRDGLLHFAGTLLAIGAAWTVLSTLMLATMLGNAAPSMDLAMWQDVFAMLSAQQLQAYALVGGALALLVFALSVVAVPLLVDRSEMTASMAMQQSVRVFFANLPAMVVWAASIVLLTAIGFATMLLALIVIFPLLGHASWHAYQDLAAPR
ncbi:MAG: DUF2189 domain-containing protein [Algiphilus sp.]